MNLGINLKEHCHVNKNGDGDRFVGIKADTENVMVYFPMGYRLSDDESLLRDDVLRLIDVLSRFNDSKDRVLAMEKFATPHSVNFPVNAYMNIVKYFLEQRTYYTEKESIKKVSDRGHINWTATLKKGERFYQDDGSPYFYKYITDGTSPNDKNLITRIHKFCVYESFMALGWIFSPYKPEDPHIDRNTQLFLAILNKKLNNTNNDQDKRLFRSMISMLEYLDSEDLDKQFYFGTDRFEYVWENWLMRYSA